VLDSETVLTELYVLIDEFCQTQLPPDWRPGPAPALSRSETMTLVCFGQWGRFASERDFWRYAAATPRPLFPQLPHRTQFNRQARRHGAAIAAFATWLAGILGAAAAPYEAVDATAVPTRTRKRRGRGWLAGPADQGWGGRLGWSHGFHLLLAVTPDGVVTGWGFGPASGNDRALAETRFAARAGRLPGLPGAGRPARGADAVDTGFAGIAGEARWLADVGAQVVAAPQANAASAAGWFPAWRRWLAGWRQIVETVIGRLQATFRLDRERPHALDGFQARPAAKVGLHNATIWLNRTRGRPHLAFADLLAW